MKAMQNTKCLRKETEDFSYQQLKSTLESSRTKRSKHTQGDQTVKKINSDLKSINQVQREQFKESTKPRACLCKNQQARQTLSETKMQKDSIQINKIRNEKEGHNNRN